jgi:hypothetical protein
MQQSLALRPAHLRKPGLAGRPESAAHQAEQSSLLQI